MKVVLFLLIMCSSIYAQDSIAVASEKGTLVVMLKNLPNNEGVVMVALSNSQENYEEEGEAYMGKVAEIKGRKAQVSFSHLPFGEYAIKVFHDEDEDNELDTNFLGIPTEAYGFSNNAKGSFGPAAWEDAIFTFSSQIDTLYIIVD
jgi:uncharacterized protein (DUF2141 family)